MTKENTLAAFLGEDDPEKNIHRVDRSTLEEFATCPMMGVLKRIRQGKDHNVVGEAAEIGTLVHEAISQAIQEYVESEGALGRQEMRESIENGLLSSRPDLQPKAIAACKRSIWALADLIAGVHPDNILGFDGGQRHQNAQLAKDYDFGTVTYRVTSELDLILAGNSPEVVESHDWKSGWKRWNEKIVKESFQFSLHADLLLDRFPDVQAVDVKVWATATNQQTFPCRFTRKDLTGVQARVMSALMAYHKFRQASSDDAEAWPTREKCRICDVAYFCKAAPQLQRLTAQERLAAIDEIAFLEDRTKVLRKEMNATLKKLQEESGDDEQSLYSPKGTRYYMKRSTTRKATIVPIPDPQVAAGEEDENGQEKD